MIQDFDGKAPRIHETAWVHDGAWVIGAVELGPEVSVWPTAVLRGDMGRIVVGARSNLQDGVVCHDTTDLSETLLGERVTVGHKAILHGCVIDDDCLIGMGAILMDNVRIGSGSLVAAGTLIPVGREIPPGSVVMGSPGRVVGPATDEHRAMIEEGWRSYTAKAREWLARESSPR